MDAAISRGLPAESRIMELNDTHVFNTDWPPHARLHEVWQLFANTGIGLFCLFLVWFKNQLKLAGILGIFVTGGFLAAFTIQRLYGGSMKYLAGTENTAFGLNLGVVAFGVTILIFIAACIVTDKTDKINRH